MTEVNREIKHSIFQDYSLIMRCNTMQFGYILITNFWCTDYYLFIKYYSPLHVSSLKCSSSGGYICTRAAYGTVTLYESSWWPVGTQLEWELTVGGRLLVAVLRHQHCRIFSQQDVSLGEETSGNRWAQGPDCRADGPIYPTFTFCIEKSYDGTHLAFGGTSDQRCHFRHVSHKQSRFYHCQMSMAHR